MFNNFYTGTCSHYQKSYSYSSLNIAIAESIILTLSMLILNNLFKAVREGRQ